MYDKLRPGLRLSHINLRDYRGFIMVGAQYVSMKAETEVSL